MSSGDLDILKSLWENINDICVPPSPPGTPANACFLMEMPGFAIDPDAFDVSKFTVDQMSPDLAKATLCDRVPFVARSFYDTGNRISFLWRNFLQTFVIEPDRKDADKLRKQNYDKAIEALFGSRDGFIQQKKTPFYERVDTLREKWEKAKEKEAQFRNKCQKDTANWPENFKRGVGPYRSEVDERYSEYHSVKVIVDKHEAAIYAYASEDLSGMMREQESSKCACMHGVSYSAICCDTNQKRIASKAQNTWLARYAVEFQQITLPLNFNFNSTFKSCKEHLDCFCRLASPRRTYI